MDRHLLIAIIFLIMAPTLMAETPQQFVERVEKAIAVDDEAGRKKEIEKLFYFKGADEKSLAIYQKFTIPRLVKMKGAKAKLLPLPQSHRQEYVSDGVKYRANLPHLGLISLNDKIKMPYGKAEGKFVLPAMVSEVVSALKDLTYNVIVVATATDGHGKFSGECQFKMSDGSLRTIAMADEGNGNRTIAIRAQAIHDCQITAQSELANYRVVTTKEGEAGHTFDQTVTLKKGERFPFQSIHFSCDKSRATGTCEEYRLKRGEGQSLIASCKNTKNPNVKFLSGPCPSQNRVALCTLKDNSKIHYYSGTAKSYDWKRESVKTTCDARQGVFK